MIRSRPARIAIALALATFAGISKAAQTSLESVSIAGSKAAKDAVMAITALKIGAPIDQAAIEEACKRLQATGLFTSVEYTFRPGPKQGLAVTLNLQDAGPLINAAIDIPEADEAALWKWMMSLYPTFDHKVPGGAQDFLAGQIERQASGSLNGEHVVARQEGDLASHRSFISFQPEKLPQIAWVAFEGNHAIGTQDLQAVLAKVLPGQGYTERSFRFLVENNIRPAYEDIGMYRVQFPAVRAQKDGPGSMGVTLTIAESPVYTLGQIDLTGDNVPPDLVKSANLPIGKAANWTLIQKGIWAMQSKLVVAGYLDTTERNERIFDDQAHVLNIKVALRTGPLYHFGQVSFAGLPSNLESIARSTWSRSSADAYDFHYPEVFMREFSKQADLRQLKYKVESSKKMNATVDVNMVFTPR
jgi:outer membrane protein assembly factor BamA